MTDGKYQALFFIGKRRSRQPGFTHKSWGISSLHLSRINFLFFDFAEVGRMIGNGTAGTESKEDHLQHTMHLSQRHAFSRANPPRDPFLNPLNLTKMRPWSFPFAKCDGAPVGGVPAAEATQSRFFFTERKDQTCALLHTRVLKRTALQSTWGQIKFRQSSRST